MGFPPNLVPLIVKFNNCSPNYVQWVIYLHLLVCNVSTINSSLCICLVHLLGAAQFTFCVGAFAEGRSVEAQIAPSLRSRCCALPAARDLLVTSREGLVSRWGSQLPHDRKRAITEDKFNSALNDKWSNRSLSGS